MGESATTVVWPTPFCPVWREGGEVGWPVLVAGMLLAGSLALTGCDSRNQPVDPLAPQEKAGKTREAEDPTLPGRINQALLADSSINSRAISVTTDKGQVTLNGSVPAEQIIRADAIVRGVTGVKEVINALQPTVAPPAPRPTAPPTSAPGYPGGASAPPS